MNLQISEGLIFACCAECHKIQYIMDAPPIHLSLVLFFIIIMQIFDKGSHLNGSLISTVRCSIPIPSHLQHYFATFDHIYVFFPTGKTPKAPWSILLLIHGSCQYTWIIDVGEIIVDFRIRIAMFDSVPLD